jgi:hypothetical protein
MEEHKVAEPHNWFQYIPETTHTAPEPKIEDEKEKKIINLSEENELLKKQLADLQKTTEDRFNTIAVLLQDLQKNKK